MDKVKLSGVLNLKKEAKSPRRPPHTCEKEEEKPSQIEPLALGSSPGSRAMADPLGREGGLGHLVWEPYAQAAPPRPATNLELKLGCLALLLIVTLACGFLPLWVLRRTGAAAGTTGSRRKVLSLVSCFAGGVFLATCLLDLIPDYLAGINEVLDELRVTLRFPLQEFILAMGFFLVLTLEQVVLAYKDPSGSLEETQALLAPHPSATAIQDRSWPDGPSPRQPPRTPGPAGERPHVHVDFNAHSAVRSVVLLLALSLHSALEGLAVGLQEDGGRALEICLALLIHKGVIAFSLGLKLLQGRLRPRAVAGSLVLFSLMSPLGLGLGVALTESAAAPLHRLSRSVLEGLAAGSFVYVTFMEILPHELGASEQRILKDSGPVGEQINQRRSPHHQRLEFGVPKEMSAGAPNQRHGGTSHKQRNPTTPRAVFLRRVGLNSLTKTRTFLKGRRGSRCFLLQRDWARQLKTRFSVARKRLHHPWWWKLEDDGLIQLDGRISQCPCQEKVLVAGGRRSVVLVASWAVWSLYLRRLWNVGRRAQRLVLRFFFLRRRRPWRPVSGGSVVASASSSSPSAAASNPRKFSEKIALQKQRQAEETAAFEEVMMELGTTRLQAQKLRLAHSRGPYYGGSLPNVNQIGSGTSEFQGHLHSPLDTARGTRHHGLVERVQRDPRRMVSPLRPYVRQISFLAPLIRPAVPWGNFPAEKGQLFRLPSALNRTNSDSALHTSVMNPNPPDAYLGPSQGPPPPSRKSVFLFQVPSIEENLLDENRQLLKPWDTKKLSSSSPRPRSCEVPGIHIFPSPDQPANLPLIPAALNTGGSLPDLTNLHFPSPLPTPLDPDESGYPGLSGGSSTGNLAHTMTHLGISGSMALGPGYDSPGLCSSMQSSLSNPCIQSSLSNPSLQSSLSNPSLRSSPSSSSIPSSMSNQSLPSSLSNPSLSSSLSSQSVQSTAGNPALQPQPQPQPGFGSPGAGPGAPLPLLAPPPLLLPPLAPPPPPLPPRRPCPPPTPPRSTPRPAAGSPSAPSPSPWAETRDGSSTQNSFRQQCHPPCPPSRRGCRWIPANFPLTKGCPRTPTGSPACSCNIARSLTRRPRGRWALSKAEPQPSTITITTSSSSSSNHRPCRPTALIPAGITSPIQWSSTTTTTTISTTSRWVTSAWAASTRTASSTT
ncbi:hypothetical protein JRQ81_009311 [Phrynocephalus forsythii]|uniref:Solute carrier family 39 member 1 n=1 Tax=Phrynocephalus forsythii TaxID=171643 RepID=A0A9Q0XBL2_9SAUR|nr:hypothetical protein JRQ81_009311 [Phrynocephalus forsythii]